MKNYKKISVALSMVFILLQSVLPVSYAERVVSTEDAVAEISSTEIKMISDTHPKEFSALYSLGIISGNAESDRVVTRGELASVLYSVNKPYAQGALGFRDVDPDSEIATAVNAVTEYGYMAGYGDGTFRPTEPVTYTDVVYALLTIAGYEKIADVKGGFPNGYHTIAAANKMKCSEENINAVTYGDMMVILYNYLSTNVVKMSASDDKQLMYESEMTVLEEFFDLYEGKGIVYANEYIALKGRKKTPKGMAIVEYENKESTIEVGNSGIDDYVGYYVKYYFNEKDEIVFCEPYDSKFTELEVTEENFYGIDKNLVKFEYRNKEKSGDSYGNISSTADFVYNGKSCYEITAEDFDKADYIRFIDNDTDGKYDVVYLHVYDSYMVGTVSYKQKVIQDQRENIYYTFNEDKWEITYEKNGMVTDINIIKEWDVLNIEESKDDDKLVKVNISSDIISGTVESLDVNERKMTVGGEEYFISKKIDINTVVTNAEVVAGLNKFGAVVCIKQMKKEREYAYLINITRDDSEEAYSVKVINQSGKPQRIAIDEKFYINNHKGTWEELAGYIADYNPSVKEYGTFTANYQLVAYRTNEEGKLDRLYTAGEAQGAREAEYAGELVLNKKFSNLRMRTQFPTINAEYLYEKDTPIFVIVKDNDTNEVIEEFCFVKTKNTIGLTEGTRPIISVFDAGKERVAGVILLEMKQAELTGFFDLTSRQGFLVTEIRTALNSYNEPVTEYVGITSGTVARYQENEFYDFSSWKVGDLWVVTKDVNNNIINAKKLFEINPEEGSKTMNPYMDFSSNKATVDLNSGSTTNDYTETHTGVYGTLTSVFKINGSAALKIRPEGLDEEVVYGLSGTSIVVCRKDGTFEQLSPENLSVGIGSGKIFCYTRYGLCRDIIIFE